MISNKLSQIILTNWINIAGVFVAVYFHAAFIYLTANVQASIVSAMVASLILVLLYGFIFWGLLILGLMICDLLFVRSGRQLMAGLILEWLVVSSPFVYWFVKYHQGIFLTGIIMLLFTQIGRYLMIRRMRFQASGISKS